MKILMRMENQCFIIKVDGPFDDLDGKILQEALERSTGSFCRKVLIDLKNLESITPTGQRLLLIYLTKLQSQHIPLILCNVSTKVYQALSSSGLDKIILILPTLQAAQAL